MASPGQPAAQGAPEAAAGASAARRTADDRLGRKAAKGSVWVVAGYGGAQVVRFASNLVLARLLFPRAFGLMLLVNVFLQGLQLFSDLGIRASIVQHARADAAYLNTAWTVQIIRGTVLWLLTFALGWPVAVLYGEPQLRWMIPIAGAVACIDGFVSTKMHSAQRELRIGKIQLFELTVQMTASLVMIAAAWATRSVWALVAGMLAGSLTRAVLSHVAFPGVRNRLLWDRASARSLLDFGKWVFASSAVTFLAQQGDRLVFGRMLPIARLGVYNIALSLVDAPASLVSAVSSRVFFPMFAELRRRGPHVDQGFRRASSAMALLSGAAALGVFVAGPFLVGVLYDARYAEASWILRLLALGIWGSSLVHLTAAVVMAGARLKWLAGANAARLVWIAGVVPLAFFGCGFEVAIACVALADLPRYVVLGLGCRGEGLDVFRDDGRRTAVLLVAAAAGLGVLRLAGSEGLAWVTLACAVSLAVWIGGNLEAARWYLEKARGGARA